MALDKTLRNLNDCGCCEGNAVKTPVKVYNRSGLTVLAYRVGNHEKFKQTLLTRLSASGQPALRELTTRNDDDFSIALMDAWAMVADVLTFYQERIANESYLRTATERQSILELARLIGYELSPGVAAGTYLAFKIEDTPGALSVGPTEQNTAIQLPPVTIDIGTKVQSVPGAGEQAQTFETIEKIEARAGWNTIKPRLTQPQILSGNMGSIILQGTAANLKQGGKLLIIDDSEIRTIKTVMDVTPYDEKKITRIDFDSPELSPSSYDDNISTQAYGQISEFADFYEFDMEVVEKIYKATWREEDLSALIEMKGWSEDQLITGIEERKKIDSSTHDKGVFAFRRQGSLFGYNATKQVTCDGTSIPNLPAEWIEWDVQVDEVGNKIYLDNAYEEIIPSSYIAIKKLNEPGMVFEIQEVEIRSRTAYGMSSKTTEISLSDGSWWEPNTSPTSDISTIRTTMVHTQSEQLLTSEVPIEELVKEGAITLDRIYLGLKVGQKIILTGERDDLKGVFVSEILELKEVFIEKGFTAVTFINPLSYDYVRSTVTINANIAEGTHGESVHEVLGSGDAGQSFQSFTLRQPPLTYVSASTPNGTQTSLEIRVNELLWEEASSFYGRGSEERIYVTRSDDDKTIVVFGDGKAGSRLPTGRENVKAKYRKGIGLSGLVNANQLSQLMSRPLGVNGAVNPLASSDAADKENLSEARKNAPLTVLTLDRTVSLKDYEDFARAFAGIDKALATWSWSGLRRKVFVTVAGSEGAVVEIYSTLHENLFNAMLQYGDPNIPLQIESYKPRLFRVKAKIEVKPDYLEEDTLSAVMEKLRESFSFESREFGEPVTLSEIVAIMQNVTGVNAVDVDNLYFSEDEEKLNYRLEAAKPVSGNQTVFAAEILTLDPAPFELEVMS